jgi:hypothetical protein
MKAILAAAVAALALTAAVPAAQADTRVRVGRLACDVAPGVGLIVVSSKNLTCKFYRNGFKTEVYKGRIDKIGIDIGVTGYTHIEWLVFSASNTKYGKGSLRGKYVGGSAEATFGVGLGGNWLVGGSSKGYALQPLSIQGQIGLNWAVTLSGLTLN